MNRLLAIIVVASMPALAAWLPRVGQGFDPQSHGQASWTPKYDYFVCTSAPIATPTPFANFDYAIRGCPNLRTGTTFVYGPAGTKGHVLYDAVHKTVMYQEGCCAWRNAVLASGIAPPPSSVRSGNLSAVRTQRGLTLGMTQAQVARVYGKTAPHSVRGVAGVTMLSYTTMHGNPSSPANACGQFQNFAFRDGKLFYIELLAGC
jgi:hypothetical protein